LKDRTALIPDQHLIPQQGDILQQILGGADVTAALGCTPGLEISAENRQARGAMRRDVTQTSAMLISVVDLQPQVHGDPVGVLSAQVHRQLHGARHSTALRLQSHSTLQYANLARPGAPSI